MSAPHLGAVAAPVASVDAPAAPCLIVNPASFRASRGRELARLLATARARGLDIVEIDGMAALSGAVERILARQQRHVVVYAGDGTVHAIVDQLASRAAGAWMPDLLVLPGGRSNMTAADLVAPGCTVAALERALDRLDDDAWDEALEERYVLRVEQSPAPPRHGFLLGAALVDSVIRYCHDQRRRGGWRTGALSTPWCLLKLGVLSLFGRTGMACPKLRVLADGYGPLQGRVRVLLATTLRHPIGWFNPYADRGRGDLRVTAVSLAAPRFWWRLPRVLTGRFRAGMNEQKGYLSGRCTQLEIHGLTAYSLDGEKFDTDPDRPVRIGCGPRIRLLRP